VPWRLVSDISVSINVDKLLRPENLNFQDELNQDPARQAFLKPEL